MVFFNSHFQDIRAFFSKAPVKKQPEQKPVVPKKVADEADAPKASKKEQPATEKDAPKAKAKKTDKAEKVKGEKAEKAEKSSKDSKGKKEDAKMVEEPAAKKSPSKRKADVVVSLICQDPHLTRADLGRRG